MKRKKRTEINPRLLTLAEVSDYIGQGLTKTREWLKSINAETWFGGSVRYDKEIIDRELDLMHQ